MNALCGILPRQLRWRAAAKDRRSQIWRRSWECHTMSGRRSVKSERWGKRPRQIFYWPPSLWRGVLDTRNQCQRVPEQSPAGRAGGSIRIWTHLCQCIMSDLRPLAQGCWEMQNHHVLSEGAKPQHTLLAGCLWESHSKWCIPWKM